MPDVLRDYGKSKMKRRCPDQQVCERKDNTARSLSACYRARTLGNLVKERMYSQRRTKIPQERFSHLALFRRLRPLDSVCELDNSHGRHRRHGFPTAILNLFQYFGNAAPAPFRGHEDARIEDYSHTVGFQG